jgi:hypothetical protein
MAIAGTYRQPRAGDSPFIVLLPIAVLPAVLAASLLALNPLLTLLLTGGLIALVVAAVWPRAGLGLVVLAAVLGDARFHNPDVATFGKVFWSLAGLSVTPVELLMVAAFVGLAARLLFDARTEPRAGELCAPIVVLTAAILPGIAVGLQRGAEMDVLRAEVRGFLYLPALYLVAVHFLKTRAQVHHAVWLFVIAVNVMAAENIYRYYTSIRGTYELKAAYDLAYAHEDSLFCAATIVLLLARMVWTRSIVGEWRSLALMVLPMLALLVMRRRAGMVALDAGLILLCIVLLKDNLKLFLISVPLALVGLGLLLALTWNEPGGTGQLARSVQTISGRETATAARDESSNRYREFEAKNVEINIKSSPVTGLGFGRPYAFYLPLNDLSFWPLWRYVPHNSVLWVWMKAGVLAFAALLALFATALMRSVQLVNGMRGDSMKPIAFALGAAVLMFVLYSWVDLGLVSARAMILFGAVLGGIGAVSGITKRPLPERGAG